MSTPTLQPATRSRWMDWKPKARILADTAENEPTKTSETDFVVFVGATSAESPEIEAGLDPAELARASAVLNRASRVVLADVQRYGGPESLMVRWAQMVIERAEAPPVDAECGPLFAGRMAA